MTVAKHNKRVKPDKRKIAIAVPAPPLLILATPLRCRLPRHSVATRSRSRHFP